VTVQPGQPFPSFTGPNQDGESVNLSDYRGDDNLVVFFFPRALTSG
jgi:thioredoxin-dependent peroxiredoxin